jgi:hypothetical protein
MKFADHDEAAFIADQLAEVADAMGTDNARASRLLLALDAEAPDSGVLTELLSGAAVRLVERLNTGDESARADLVTLLRIVSGQTDGAGE